MGEAPHLSPRLVAYKKDTVEPDIKLLKAATSLYLGLSLYSQPYHAKYRKLLLRLSLCPVYIYSKSVLIGWSKLNFRQIAKL